MNDLINKKFGLLTVIEYGGKAKSRGKTIWKCKCECGTVKNIQDNHLKSGNTKSCGCLHARKGKSSPFFKGYGDIPLTFYTRIKHACEKPQKYRDKKQFLVSIEYLWELYINQNKKCAISGVEIAFNERQGSRGRCCSASLDRIDSSKGYIEGNVQWVHKTVNIMKNKTEMNDFLSWCNKIAKYNEDKT